MSIMNVVIIYVVIVLVVAAVLLWLANRFFPMDQKTRLTINSVVAVGVILWLLSLLGLFGYLFKQPYWR